MIDTEINSKNYREIAADIALNSEEISLEIMWELEDEDIDDLPWYIAGLARDNYYEDIEMPLINEVGKWADRNGEKFEELVEDEWTDVRFERLYIYALGFFYELVPEHFKELDDMVIRDCGYGDALDALNLLAKYADVSTVYYRILDRAVDGIMKAIEIDRPDLIYDHE